MEKAKNEETYGLHHTPFTLMWMSVPAVAMGILFVIAVFLIGVSDLPVVEDILYWLGNEGRLLLALLVGLGLGITTSIAQAWLIRQRYGFAPRFWHILTVIGWTVAGIAFYALMEYSYSMRNNNTEQYLYVAWFVAAPSFQMFALWSQLRAGAIGWGLAGIASGFVVMLAYHLAPNYEQTLYAVTYGTLAQSFFTAMTLLFLMSRRRRLNINQAALVTE